MVILDYIKFTGQHWFILLERLFNETGDVITTKPKNNTVLEFVAVQHSTIFRKVNN